MSHLRLRRADGHTFWSSAWPEPESPRAAGVVVRPGDLQRDRARRTRRRPVRRRGLLAVAPAVFDRQDRGVDLAYDDAGARPGVGKLHAARDFGDVVDRPQRRSTPSLLAGALGDASLLLGGLVAYLAGSQRRRRRGVAYSAGIARLPRACAALPGAGTVGTASRTRTSPGRRGKDAAPRSPARCRAYAAGHRLRLSTAQSRRATAHLAFAGRRMLSGTPGLTREGS